MVRPEVEPGMIFSDLIANLVATLDTIVTPLLTVLDPVGAISS
jgi:hypothetical protein